MMNARQFRIFTRFCGALALLMTLAFAVLFRAPFELFALTALTEVLMISLFIFATAGEP